MDASKIYNNTLPPYDIIGDLHGCIDELRELFGLLGYKLQDNIYVHPEHRMPIFIGDLTDRGPGSIAILDLVTKMYEQKKALFVPGNHDVKLKRWLDGAHIKIFRGIETTVKEFARLDPVAKLDISNRFCDMFNHAPPYLVLDDGKLVIAHAGIKKEYIGKFNEQVKNFIMFGDITGKTDAQGFPIRLDWAVHYQGHALIVYGHTPIDYPVFRHNTINIDAGCAFGGNLCAVRYPERTIECVPAKKVYYVRH